MVPALVIVRLLQPPEGMRQPDRIIFVQGSLPQHHTDHVSVDAEVPRCRRHHQQEEETGIDLCLAIIYSLSRCEVL